MNFWLEVYSGDEHLGAVTLANRYVNAVIDGETYPFKNVEDACVCLLATRNQRDRNDGNSKAKSETQAES